MINCEFIIPHKLMLTMKNYPSNGMSIVEISSGYGKLYLVTMDLKG